MNLQTNQKYTILAVIAIIAIAAIYYSQSPSPSTSSDSGEILASVNGQSVSLGEVQRAQETVQLQTGNSITQEQAIQRVISEKLIIEEAEKIGLSISTEEAEAQLKKEVMLRGKTLDDIKQSLEAQGKSYDEEIEIFREQMTVQALLEEEVPRPEISDEEARTYYDENKEKLFTGEIIVPYEQIDAQLKTAIATSKQQKEINAYLDNLKQDAEIEYLN